MTTLIGRFLAKILVSDTDCWEWTGSIERSARGGYGMFRWNGCTGLAHRFAYETFKGSIPKGLEIDHLCRNRKCVNPNHLEVVTRSENHRRGLLGVLRNQPYCKNGHPFDETNTRVDSLGHRICRTCHRELVRVYCSLHKDERKQTQKKYQVENKEKLKEYRKYLWEKDINPTT